MQRHTTTLGRLAAATLVLGTAGALGACRGLPDPPTYALVRPVRQPPLDGFRSDLMFATPGQSVHRAVVSEPLAAHLHREHTETVVVLAGHGRMRLGERWLTLEPGSVVYIPPGTPHAVEPRGLMTAVSLFQPPFDGRDRVHLPPPPGR